MRSSNTLRRGLAIAVLLSGQFSFADGLVQAEAATLCKADERTQFSCQMMAKTASLCATGNVDAPSSLTYRYGTSARIEMSFVALPTNAQRFFATASPASPGASVRQVWFDRGTTRYLMTECVGGMCSRDAGLAVLRGDRVLMNRSCERTGEPRLALFSRELLTFGADAPTSRSATPLVQIEDADNELSQLYPAKAPALR